jgi:S-DNA-T family DNA segregation ATPase FtsK/SpoIIIE
LDFFTLPELGGTIGYELNLLLQDYIGKTGTLLILIFGLIIYIIFKIKLSPERIQSFFDTTKKKHKVPQFLIQLIINSGYNLEEFAAVDDVDEIHLKRMAHNLKLTKKH